MLQRPTNLDVPTDGSTLTYPSYFDAHPRSALYLGSCIDIRFLEQPKPNLFATEAEDIDKGAPQTAFELQFVRNTSQLQASLHIDQEMEADMLIASGDVHSSLDASLFLARDSVALVITATSEYSRQAAKLSLLPNFGLKKEQQDENQNRYGTHYVSMIRRGSRTSIVLEMDKHVAQEKLGISVKASGSADLGVISGSASVNVVANFARSAQEQKLTIKLYSQGGQGFGSIGDILSAFPPQTSQSTNDAQIAQEFLKTVLTALKNYISSFNKDNAVPIGYYLTPLQWILPEYFPSAEVTRLSTKPVLNKFRQVAEVKAFVRDLLDLYSQSIFSDILKPTDMAALRNLEKDLQGYQPGLLHAARFLRKDARGFSYAARQKVYAPFEEFVREHKDDIPGMSVEFMYDQEVRASHFPGELEDPPSGMNLQGPYDFTVYGPFLFAARAYIKFPTTTASQAPKQPFKTAQAGKTVYFRPFEPVEYIPTKYGGLEVYPQDLSDPNHNLGAFFAIRIDHDRIHSAIYESVRNWDNVQAGDSIRCSVLLQLEDIFGRQALYHFLSLTIDAAGTIKSMDKVGLKLLGGPEWPDRGNRERFTEMTYIVDGDFSILEQPSDNTCWATVYTMMKNWRNSSDESIPAAVAALPEPFPTLLDADEGMPPDQFETFVSGAGMSHSPMSNMGPEGWYKALKQHGLLWVGTLAAVGSNGLHSRIVRGIYSDGSPEQTIMLMVDPADGRQHNEDFNTFVAKYEGAFEETHDAQYYQLRYFV